MAGNMGKWLSEYRKTEKSGHRSAAAEKRCQRRRKLGALAMKLMLIWEMSEHCAVRSLRAGVTWRLRCNRSNSPTIFVGTTRSSGRS